MLGIQALNSTCLRRAIWCNNRQKLASTKRRLRGTWHMFLWSLLFHIVHVN